MSEKLAIPDDIMEAAEDVGLEIPDCTCDECRQIAVHKIALAILAERNRHNDEDQPSTFSRCLNG